MLRQRCDAPGLDLLARAARLPVPEPFEKFSSPSVFAWKESPSDALPQRWKGAGDFVIGRPSNGTTQPVQP
jgi:hypothetical protein